MYVFAVHPSARNPHLDAHVRVSTQALGACDAYTHERVLLQESVNVIKFQPPGPASRERETITPELIFHISRS